MKFFRCKKRNKITTNRKQSLQLRGLCDKSHTVFLQKKQISRA